LLAASDAIVIDTTTRDADAVFATVADLVARRLARPR
jgi:cytidylate kinase